MQYRAVSARSTYTGAQSATTEARAPGALKYASEAICVRSTS